MSATAMRLVGACLACLQLGALGLHFTDSLSLESDRVPHSPLCGCSACDITYTEQGKGLQREVENLQCGDLAKSLGMSVANGDSCSSAVEKMKIGGTFLESATCADDLKVSGVPEDFLLDGPRFKLNASAEYLPQILPWTRGYFPKGPGKTKSTVNDDTPVEEVDGPRFKLNSSAEYLPQIMPWTRGYFPKGRKTESPGKRKSTVNDYTPAPVEEFQTKDLRLQGLKHDNFGCHELTTESECISSRDGRNEMEFSYQDTAGTHQDRFGDSPCQWCCGQSCKRTMGNTPKCENKEWLTKVAKDMYVGFGKNGLGENNCPA